MTHAITLHLTRDHRALARLFAIGVFQAFRARLLTHIAIEEKLLMPLLADAGRSPELLASLRADHSALAALTIPTPRPELVSQIRGILRVHDRLEEGAGGLYEQCAALAGARSAGLMRELEAFPLAVPSPHRDGDAIERHIARSLEHAERLRVELLR